MLKTELTTLKWCVPKDRPGNNTYIYIWPQLDEETFSLKAQFANFRPVEGVYPCASLKGQRIL